MKPTVLLVYLVGSLLGATTSVQSVPARREHICTHSHDNNQYNHYHVKPGPRFNGGSELLFQRRQDGLGDTFSERFNMKVFYDQSVSSGLSSGVQARLKTKIIPILTAYFDNILSVRPLKGPILVDRSCEDGSYLVTDTDVRYCSYQCERTTMCGEATVPTDHLKRCAQCNGQRVLSQCTTSGSDGPGVDGSFILYVSAKTAGSCPRAETSEGTVAYAGSCGMEKDYDRPIVGYANFCPYSLNDDVTDDFIIAVAKHEIHHALGFSDGQYAFWRDENGKPRTARDSNGMPPFNGYRYVPDESTFKTVTYRDWESRKGPQTHSVYLLSTPKIVQEGKAHFACSSLEGVEVENQGGSGTMWSHWEKRIVENEGMTGIVSHSPRFSRLTFALLEDSGWYKVNYSYAQEILWGKNSGCNLASASCLKYMETQKSSGKSIDPFCDYLAPSNGNTGCSLDRAAVSECNLGAYTSALPNEYQYFNTWSGVNSGYDPSGIGGRTQIADFCPYQSAYSNGNCDDTANSKGTGLDNALAETYGTGSRCVVHGSRWKAQSRSYYIQQSAIKSGCYKYKCSKGKVYIDILGTSYTCDTKGKIVQVSQTTDGVTYTGSIVCPACSEICYDDPVGCPTAEVMKEMGVASKVTTDNNLLK